MTLSKFYSKKGVIKIFFFLVLSTLKMNSQESFHCYGAYANGNNSTFQTCTNSSPAYQNFYSKQSSYIPTQNSALITLKITIHVFTNNDGSGQWQNNAASTNNLQSMLAGITNATERFSDPRSADYYVPNFTSNFILDSKVKYEISNIYYYPNTTLYNLNAYPANQSQFTSYINSQFPGQGRLEEGLPIIINATNQAHQTFYNGAPIVFVSIGPSYGLFASHSQLRHEIGHCFGLMHCYNGVPPSCCPENIDCSSVNNPDFLSDVFPTGNTNCNPYPTSNAPCNTCYEDTPIRSNNLMDNKENNTWMSPLQMARRRRLMYLKSGNDIRRFAKETISDHVNVKNIAASETWDFDIQMYEDIIVKTGNTLTIKCKLWMAKEGKIKIEKGAKLVVDGGEINTWSKTGLWKGIEVDGNSSQNQNVSGGYGVYQGYLNIINNSTISNAQNAICTYTTDANGNMNTSSTGGIVICNTANFINNVRSAEFYYYYNPNGGNLSSFTKCNFNTISTLRASAAPSHHVTMYNIDGINFFGCNFEYSAGSAYANLSRGNGIYSIDAKYFVNQYSTIKTTFKNLVNGIVADNSNPLRVVSITNTEFYDNIYYSTYFNTMYTPVFTDNYIRTGSTGFGVGLYLNNCKYYNVKNNVFLESSNGFANDIGVYVNNSTTGLHKIYRNSFANFLIAVDAQDNNSGAANNTDGLKINCNDFTPSANLYDVALVGQNSPTVMKNQGTNASAITLVRNRYSAASLCSNCENKWYIEGTSVRTINHPANSDANTRPIPQPQNSDVDLIVTNSGIPFNSTHCPPTESDGGGSDNGRLSNINNYIHNLVTENISAKGTNPNSILSEDFKSAMYTKLNYFLLDTLQSSNDSVISLLQSNLAGMDDADVLLTYAYINKGDFASAQQNIGGLNNKNDWKSLQQALLSIHQNPSKANFLKSNLTAKGFFQNYTSNGLKDGTGAAQSILKYVTGQNYFIPRLVPFVDNGINKSINSTPMSEENYANFSVFPNPATNAVNFAYRSKDENTVQVILTNALGKIVYEIDVRSNTTKQISIDNLATGVYILTAFDGKKEVFKTKLIRME